MMGGIGNGIKLEAKSRMGLNSDTLIYWIYEQWQKPRHNLYAPTVVPSLASGKASAVNAKLGTR